MLNNKTMKYTIAAIIALALLSICTVSHAYVPKVSSEEGRTVTSQSVRYSANIGDSYYVSWEDLALRKYLDCIEHGAFLPSKLSASRPERDSTIEINGTSRYIRQLTESNSILGRTRGDAYSTNPYGADGTLVETVFTTGVFHEAGTKSLTDGEAFILSHSNLYNKSRENYPNEVQVAVWNYIEGGRSANITTMDELNTSMTSATNGGRDLFKAATILDSSVAARDEFRSAHNGADVAMKTDYSNFKIGYSKSKNTVITGPYTLDYVFSMYQPKTELTSNLLNENGALEFSTIANMQLYADDAMRQEISNFEIIYPDRGADQNTITLSDNSTTTYPFPLPGEKFYIEFDNNEYGNTNSLSQLKVTTKGKSGQGEVSILEGTSQQVDYCAQSEPIECLSMRTLGNTNQCAMHPEHQVGDGHARAYTYYVSGEMVAELDVQDVEYVRFAQVPTQTNYTTLELGEPAAAPYILPIIVPIGWYRDNETEYVPVLPVDPDPNDPPTPPKPDDPDEPDPEIKLTFDMAGTVWLDNLLGKETIANGVKDEFEKGLQNIIVRLYKVGEVEPIRETLTNENGEYLFQNIRVGYDYYVEFTYDGMTYTTTNYMGSGARNNAFGDFEALNAAYRANPENYLNNSHAIEDYAERLAFNSKFMEISNNQAFGSAGIIPLSYRTYMSEQGAVSALITTDNNYVVAEPFQMTASTKTADLYYLLDENYVVSESDLNLTEINGEHYYHATYPGTLHVNLGLVKRERADFAVKNDVYQTLVTKDGEMQTYRYNDKTTDILTYDAYTRDAEYYTDSVYVQKLDRADYNVKYDEAQYKGVKDIREELNVYVEYKYLIRNQSPLRFGSVLELTNNFDSNLEYARSYDFTDMTSWIETNMINSDGEVYRQGISWDVQSTNNGYTTMTTSAIQDKILVPGETLELHVIFKVKKDAARNIIMDLGDKDFKENVLEISKYTFNEGMIDKDSNPGNVVLGVNETFEDDTDGAPFVKLVFNDYSENGGLGRIISGYVWEDLADEIIAYNNLYTGNGVIDNEEKGIQNVKVELIQVLRNTFTGNEIEILKQVGDTYSFRTDSNGEYMFTNLPSGEYKVKFTYGDETQLRSNIKYNGQDYKSVSTDTLKQQYQSPSMEVMVLTDTSEGMTQNERNVLVANSAKKLIESLYNSVQTIKIGATLFSEPSANGAVGVGLTTKPNMNSVLSVFDNVSVNSGTSLEGAIDSSLAQYSANAAAKVMVICTDGYISSEAKDALQRAAAAGVKVISVVCSTDEWTVGTFGTEEYTTAGKLYYVRDINIEEYMSKIALEDTLQEIARVLPNTLQAKDIQTEYKASIDSEVGDIYSRLRNIDYTDSMVYANGSVVNGKDTTNLTEFAYNTQMTAITPVRNVKINHNNSDTANTNLGLIERPKTDLEIKEEIAGIQVKLSNGEVLIDTNKDLTKNVQIIPNAKYNLFMDDEILQGSTLTVQYRVTVLNNGHVDTLGEYFDYNMFDANDVAHYTATVATKVGTIYSYYTNLTFRAEDNGNMPIEVNNVITDAETSGTTLTNWKSYIKSDGVHTPTLRDVTVAIAEDGQSKVLSEKGVWQATALVKTGVEDDSRLQDGTVKSVQTNSFNNIELYPATSREVLSGNGVASVSTYVQFSKTVSPNDPTDSLSYKQSVEIVEKLNDVGRRDYDAVPGNYVPHAEITEHDSAKVEDVVILNPFGEDMQTYYGLAAGLAVIFVAGVLFIKRRIIK